MLAQSRLPIPFAVGVGIGIGIAFDAHADKSIIAKLTPREPRPEEHFSFCMSWFLASLFHVAPFDSDTDSDPDTEADPVNARAITATISPVEELRQKLEAGENPAILDLRSKAELDQDPSVIRGAMHLLLGDVEKRRHEFPRDRDIVVYCSRPNEATAAKVAFHLQRHGSTRERVDSGDNLVVLPPDDDGVFYWPAALMAASALRSCSVIHAEPEHGMVWSVSTAACHWS